MKKLKTLGKIKFEDIKNGEVFAYDGCWCILYKVDDKHAIFLDWTNDDCYKDEMIICSMCKIRNCFNKLCFTGAHDYASFGALCAGECYKLPLSVQRLYKEE